jgi:hypothetical protein
MVPAPLAVIASILAIRDIRKTKTHGMGRAIFGLVMGILGTAVLTFGIISIAMNT